MIMLPLAASASLALAPVLFAATPSAAVPAPGSPAAAVRARQLEERAIVHSHQLQLHQAFALTTLGAMALTVGLGVYDAAYATPAQLNQLHNVHVALGGATTAAYVGAAALALTAPSAYDADAAPGWDSITVHRSLAVLHAATLATTVGLGLLTASGQITDPRLHGIFGGVTLGLMGASATVIALDF